MEGPWIGQCTLQSAPSALRNRTHSLSTSGVFRNMKRGVPSVSGLGKVSDGVESMWISAPYPEIGTPKS